MRTLSCPTTRVRKGRIQSSGILLVCVGFCIFQLFSRAAHAKPDHVPTVEVVDASTLEQDEHSEVKNLLKQAELTPLRSSLDPSIKEFQPRLKSLVEKLIRDEDFKDGARKIRIVLIDDMNVNASFTKLSEHERLITLNLGMLKFVQNDDELAFILGHELEHGPSELQAQVELLRGRGWNSAEYARRLQRAVENEADIKSALYRLHKKGYNPHASTHILDRFRTTFGEGYSQSHTGNASRKDAVGMGIAYIKRAAGETVKEDIPADYARTVTGPLKDNFLDRPEFVTLQKERAQKVLEIQHNPATEIFKKVAAGEMTTDSNGNASNYDHIADQYKKELKQLTEGIVDRKEWIDMQLQLHEKLDSLYEKARTDQLGGDFKPKTPEQLDALLATDTRYYSVERPDIIETGKKINQLKAELINLGYSGDSEENRSRRLAKQKALDAALEDYQITKHAYETQHRPGDLFPDFDKLFNETVYESRTAYAGMDHSYYDKLKAQLDSKRRVIGPRAVKVAQRETATRNGALEPILAAIRDPKGFTDERNYINYKIGRFMYLPAEIRDPHIPDAWKAYVKAANTYLKDSSSQTPLKDRVLRIVGVFSNYDTEPKKLFQQYLASDRAAAIQDFKSFFGDLIAHANDLEALEAVFGGVKEKLSVDADGVKHFESAFRGLVFDRAFAKEILTPEVVNKLVSRHLQLSTEKIATAAPNELADLIQGHMTRVQSLIGAGILPGDHLTSEAFKSSFVKMTDVAAARLHAGLSTKAGPPLSLRQAKSLLYAQTPALLKSAIQFEGYSYKQLESDVKALVPLFKATDRKTLPKISFFDLAQAFDNYPEYRNVYQLAVDASDAFDFLSPSRQIISEHGDFLAKKAMEYGDWLMRNPESHIRERNDLIVQMHTRELGYPAQSHQLRQSFDERTTDFFRKRFEHHLKKNEALPLRERMSRVSHDFWMELRPWGGTVTTNWLEIIESQIPNTSNERLDWFNGYMDGIRRMVREHPMLEHWNHGPPTEAGFNRIKTSWVTDFFNEARLLAKADPEKLSAALLHLLETGKADEKYDRIFEHLWAVTKDKPDLRRKFADESLIQKLYYDGNKKTLAKWQLEEKVKLSTAGRPSSKREVRDITRRIKQITDLQFPEKSAAKNEILGHVETALTTNEFETRFLGQGRIGLANWYESRNLGALDASHAVSRAIESNYDRLELVEYLIGTQYEQPRFVEREIDRRLQYDRDRNIAQTIRDQVSSAKKYFAGSDIHTRTYLLQPLLDAKTGVLSEAPMREKLFKVVLGSHDKNPVIRELFFAYLDAVPETEQKVILGNILGSFVDSKQKGSVSLKVVLEAMGPFGIKVGQFLRTSGLIPAEHRAELDHFLDHALPPDRQDIFKRFGDIFGKKGARVVSVQELVGAGSINYVVLAEIRNPATGETEKVVVRMLRDAVEGQVRNENEIWQRAIAKLSASKNPDAKNQGRILEEARTQAYETLKAGGVELDLEIERNAYYDAQWAYSAGQDPSTGYRIHPSKPVESIQKLVPEELSKKVSIYRHVSHTQLKNVEPRELRAKLARQIVKAEFKAAFEHGVFDPDGHPGNWLIDTSNKALVRIDYAQMRRLAEEELHGIRGTLSALIDPTLGLPGHEGAADALMANFSSVFSTPAGVKLSRSQIVGIVSDPGFPNFSSPHERLFYLRQKAEELVQKADPKSFVRLKDGARSAFASLARTQIYREHMDDLSYASSLIESVGLDLRQYSAKLAQRGTAQATVRVPAQAPADTVPKVESEARQSKKCISRGLNGIFSRKK